jgi:DNA repair protein RadA/Sms
VKNATQYICQQCGANYKKWVGKCENCDSWNSLIEQKIEVVGKSVIAKSAGQTLKTKKINAIEIDKVTNRVSTGLDELDLVLGGGLMPSGVTLIVGEPGIGKSTLLLQVANFASQNNKVLYITGEESASQVKLRALRLGADNSESLSLVGSTSSDDVAATIATGEFDLVIVDSIQTMSMNDISSAPGTVSQITNSTGVIIRAAKAASTAVVLVGHVTKEGSIAGPKILEHIVDVVLQFEGDRYGGFKMIRAVKNRYGSTSELAIFEMQESGLVPVDNPSASLLSERQNSDGSIVLATLEGNRALLVEIQALVNTSHYGYPKRTSSGFDLNRLNILIAVLEKRTKLNLSEKDVFINVVGGIKLSDPAADLAICMAIASAAAERKINSKYVVYGEVGLGGEIRSSVQPQRRISEAQKLGFTAAIAPSPRPSDPFVQPVTDLRSALQRYLT